LTNQKTSLRQKCLKQDCLASEYDNMFYFSKKVKVEKAGVENFHTQFVSLKEARKISDHIPIYGIVLIK